MFGSSINLLISGHWRVKQQKFWTYSALWHQKVDKFDMAILWIGCKGHAITYLSEPWCTLYGSMYELQDKPDMLSKSKAEFCNMPNPVTWYCLIDAKVWIFQQFFAMMAGYFVWSDKSMAVNSRQMVTNSGTAGCNRFCFSKIGIECLVDLRTQADRVRECLVYIPWSHQLINGIFVFIWQST